MKEEKKKTTDLGVFLQSNLKVQNGLWVHLFWDRRKELTFDISLCWCEDAADGSEEEEGEEE